MSKAIRPFQAQLEEAQLTDLRERIHRTRWPESQTCETWDQGVPISYARELARYWADEYDWRRWENRLNQWPQYLTEIGGIDIHFIHLRSPHDNALPMIISHGWPGSVVEFHKIIDPLTDPTRFGGSADDAFHLVIPSLPGYGFSGKPASTGTSVERIGRMWGQLMARLGYQRWVAQGGDWGSFITMSMGQTETEHCAAIHTNMPLVAPDPDTMDDLTEAEQSALAGMKFYYESDAGYSKIQSTRPQTIGYALADSPVGQMSWIIDKFYSWTDCERDGSKHLEHVLSKDELLDNVSMFWLNNCAASSARLYWESFNTPNLEPIHTPTGCSIYPKEIFRCSRRWAEKRFSRLIHFNVMDRGGHFPAMEIPDNYLDEVRTCFRAVR